MKEIRSKLASFNKRWKIIEDKDYGQKFLDFKIRILNSFRSIDFEISRTGITQFCNILAIEEKWESNGMGGWSQNIIRSLTNEDKEAQFYKLLEIIFCLPFQYSYKRTEYISSLHNIIILSNVNLAMSYSNGEVILFPKGEEILDASLVNDVLDFLPKSAKDHFHDALKFYEQKNPKSAIKSAESLRRGIEEFAKHKLSNNNGLKSNIPLLLAAMKKNLVDAQIRNVANAILNCLDQYFNENSKHEDGNISESENEFLIYQVGLLLRLFHRAIK